MQRVMIVGVETVVGGNLALTLAQNHHVVGLAAAPLAGIQGVEISRNVPQTSEQIRRELHRVRPDLVIVCGPTSESLWALSDSKAITPVTLQSTKLWAEELNESDSRLMVISTDAVFHGPWMFHEENCNGICSSATAAAVRQMEARVLESCPSALVIRTHVFGWSPKTAGGWLEHLLAKISDETALRIPAGNYATPIAASHFADFVVQAWERKLEGVYHIAGSERVNFRHFAHRLAQEFQLPRPKFQASTPQPASGFGQGEISLNCNRFRQAAGASLPMLTESLGQLREQAETGNRDELHSAEPQLALSAA